MVNSMHYVHHNNNKYARPWMMDVLCMNWLKGLCPLNSDLCKWEHFCSLCGIVDEHRPDQCHLYNYNTKCTIDSNSDWGYQNCDEYTRELAEQSMIINNSHNARQICIT